MRRYPPRSLYVNLSISFVTLVAAALRRSRRAVGEGLGLHGGRVLDHFGTGLLGAGRTDSGLDVFSFFGGGRTAFMPSDSTQSSRPQPMLW